MVDEGAPDTEERRGTGGYRGRERRKCDRGHFCINVAEAKAETRVLEERVNQEYKALHARLDEFRDRLTALPKEIADQIEKERQEAAEKITKERKEVDKDLSKGSEDFKELFERLGTLEKRVLALAIIVGIFVVGKICIWVFGLPHFL
jgi:DNA repair exonuclease SbcCD ATPase subunit